MRVAYLILAHNNPGHLARLLGRLPADSPIFIHIDKRARPDMHDRLADAVRPFDNVSLVTREYCRWGDAGIVRATARLIDAAISSGQDFDYATLLSGTDYPIKSNGRIADILEQARGQEFIEAFRMDQPNRWSDNGGLYKTPDRLLRFHIRVRGRIYATPILRRLPYGLQPFGGSQWWTLSKACLTYVRDYLASHSRLMRFVASSFIPDEALIQTVIGNSPWIEQVNQDSLRLAIWDRPEPPFPAVLKAEDFPLLEASPAMFARKFPGGGDEAILDMLDDKLLNAKD